MRVEFITFLRREVYRFLVLYKQTIIPALISSLLYIIVFGTTLGTRISSINGIPYINYIIPGLAMMSVINQAYQNSASSIMQGKYLKFIEDILVAPLSGFEISLGYIIGGALRGLICGLGILFICLFLTDLKIQNFVLTIFYLLTVSWTFSAFGVIIGIYAKSWDEIGTFTNFVFMPLTFLGGVFYSIDMLPPLWRNISYINPIYWMISGLRYSTIGLEENANLISLFICFGFSCIFTFIATWMFKTGYKIKS
ncbi:MAG: ABC transporter permease [Candidatus Marinimicrobia bacterium]|nr:ABC transporter permease [Candidatus Neomarinimicrobiota bacterium]MBS30767.1 ABC transporter permease [Candidatus Neomarinimicrobiota bacterium]|tara:strand:+ start:344 stop:1102 length:759 start_codon:yes stop_codon:yes gene_type:complete